MKIKVSVLKIEKEDICNKVEKKLKENKRKAYTIYGLMNKLSRIKEVDTKSKFYRDWKKGLPIMYRRMYRRMSICLRRLEKLGKVKSKRHGKAFFYWWAQ